MRDRETGRARGFGFVTFGSEQEAQTAIDRFFHFFRCTLFATANVYEL